MMGVYINMEMPKACKHGACLFACSAAYQTGLICTVGKRYVEPGAVPPNCPIKKLPPHGDLIDRDALSKHITVEWFCGNKRMNVPWRAVENAPTIIPADKEEQK